MHWLRCAFVLALILAANLSKAQQPACGEQAIIVNARDKQGKFPTFGLSDLRAKLGKKDLRILSVAPERKSVRVVIVFDRSGSMAAEQKARTLQAMSGQLVSTMPGAAPQFGLLVFADKVRQTEGFGKSRSEMLSIIRDAASVPGEGETALRDALQYATHLFEPAQRGDSVVIFTDGGDNHSKTSQAAIERAYWLRGIRIFPFFVVDPYRDMVTEEVSGANDLAELAAVTGGSVGVERSPKLKSDEIAPVVWQLEDVLTRYYVVRFDLPQLSDNTAPLSLELVDPAGRRRKDLKLAFPKHLPRCVGGA